MIRRLILVIVMVWIIPAEPGTAAELIPGGQSIGIVLETDGVLVTGFYSTENNSSPSKSAGIKIGDRISSVNGIRVRTADELNKVVHSINKQETVSLEVIRDHQTLTKQVQLMKSENGQNQLGFFAKHEIYGVGTLTFINPDTLQFGALGHVVSEQHTKLPVEMKSGHIKEAEVKDIQKSRAGSPGGKIAYFDDKTRMLGDIKKNASSGIFGELFKSTSALRNQKTISTAERADVQKGAAEILTVVSGHEIESFEIEILETETDLPTGGKGLKIRLSDPELLERTGGIIQGMSGSPIIQKNRLVGAVSHVLIHQPNEGYALYIEDMLHEQAS